MKKKKKSSLSFSRLSRKKGGKLIQHTLKVARFQLIIWKHHSVRTKRKTPSQTTITIQVKSYDARKNTAITFSLRKEKKCHARHNCLVFLSMKGQSRCWKSAISCQLRRTWRHMSDTFAGRNRPPEINRWTVAQKYLPSVFHRQRRLQCTCCPVQEFIIITVGLAAKKGDDGMESDRETD